MNTGIPKRIIQIWGGGIDLPLLSKASAANVRLLNPEFEYLLFDDKGMDDFVNKHFPEYRSVFHQFQFPVQRYDFFRYLAVYHLGGFYFDTDVFLASSLVELLDFGCVFPFEELTINIFLRQAYGMDWEIGNYAFGAAAGHPFVDAIIKNCVRAQNDQAWVQAMMRPFPRIFWGDFHVFNTTGPGLVSRTLAEHQDVARQVKVLFPENVNDSTYWHCFGTFGVHLMAGKWLKRKGLLKRLLTKVWMRSTTKRLFKESLRLGESRSLEFKRKT